jgi:hypothetical protein
MSMRHVAAAVVGVMFFAVACAGCSSPSSELGTADGVCYLALPTATDAVHHHGTLVGVHEFTLASLKAQSPRLYAMLATKRPRTSRVCVAAFTGTFESTSVSHPLEHRSGGLAVVVVATPSNALLGTVLYRRPPLHFGHPHVG